MRSRVFGLSTAAAAAAIVAGQVAYVAARRLPLPDGFDPSGFTGNPTKPRLRIGLLGDSSITGQGLEDVDDCWPRVIARRLSDRYYVELRSYAAGGARCRHVLERQLPLAEQIEYDIVIVSVCGNDILRLTPPWVLDRRLDEVVVRLQRVSPSVVLFGVGDLGALPRLPWPLDWAAASFGHAADWVHDRVARRRGIPKIDQWGLTAEAFNSGRHMFAADLFHPSPLGHLVWVNALLPTIEAELVRLGRESREAVSEPKMSLATDGWFG